MQLLNFTCSVLNCYLDEIKGERRGDVSKKRRITALVLLLGGLSKTEISMLLNKNLSSVCQSLKNITEEERLKAVLIIKGYQEWKKCVEKDFFN